MSQIKPIQLNVKPTAPIKPLINIGCLMDIPTGTYVEGLHGESILNGGLGWFTGVVGSGDLGKSTISHYRNIMACYRMGSISSITVYDTELNIDEHRLLSYIETATGESGYGWSENGRWLVTDGSIYSGDQWFDDFKDFMEAKKKEKSYQVETPFKDRPDMEGKVKAMKITMPTFALIDSLSNFQTKDTTKMRDTNALGDSGANMIAMTQNRQRDRVINETHHLSPSSSTYTTLTGHVGEKIQMDPYAPNFKILPSLKNNLKIKGIPPNFSFLTMSCWWLVGSTPMQNSDKTILYPKDSQDKNPNEKDLNLVSMTMLRSKTGPSDVNISIILSKKEGVLPSLTEFYYCLKHDRFGLVGNDQRYVNALLPTETLQRTTIRGKLDTNPLLRRAFNITSELCQMHEFWKGKIDNALLCDAETLYKDISELGYDWNLILSSTRGWWTLKGVHEESLFLSTMDLLKMRLGRYHPYWLEKDKKTIKKEYKSKIKPEIVAVSTEDQKD